ncbi:MAG: glycosyltransferase family 2 protein [Algoriphagus sp.]|uniref:glycosyltransferase family 2 protein n=2 Tax=Algoriphagus sp. TaxID=1872435 RepID=UPI00329736BD
MNLKKSGKLLLAIRNITDLDISIIVPCYNHGLFLREAVRSVRKLAYINFEIIIVNDGSTDAHTILILNQLAKEGFTVYNQNNLGLAVARNQGISISTGKYIIPLDSDNKLDPEGIEEAFFFLEQNECDIVYGRPEFFGELDQSRYFYPQEFDIFKLLTGNYIDACAMYRREVWETCKGYDTKMPSPGHEDWEFWINSYKNKFRFKFLNRRFFYYQIRKESMITVTLASGGLNDNFNYILSKHSSVFTSNYNTLYSVYKSYNRLKIKPLRTSLKFFLIWLKIKE